MSKFKGFVYGGPVPGSAGFYFGQGAGGPGICSGASPALVHVNFVNSRFYTRTSGQVGITSNGFADLLTFTGAPGREYIDANGDTVVVGLNEPRIGSYIDIGSGLFDAGIRFNSGNGEAMKFNAAVLQAALGATMPAAVTIAIEGYMTYADEDAFNTVTHFSWETGDGTGVISYGLSTSGSDTGSMFFTHRFDSVFYNSKGPDDKSPGTNVPFSYSSAHTSSRCRGASDGVLGTARVTLGIPDLIASDFEIAPTFNGNITSLTILADDITDPRLQAATAEGSGFNPLCPFDG